MPPDAVDVDVDEDGDSWSSSTPKQFVGLGSQLKNKRHVEEYLVSKRVDRQQVGAQTNSYLKFCSQHAASVSKIKPMSSIICGALPSFKQPRESPVQLG